MSWFRPGPSAEKLAVDDAMARAQAERERRRSALRKLMRALDEIPLDDGLVKVGDDLARTPEGGHDD